MKKMIKIDLRILTGADDLVSIRGESPPISISNTRVP